MTPITIADYLGKYADHPDATSAVRRTAARMLDAVNAGLIMAELDGVVLRVNPITGSLIGGQGNGGFRPTIAVDRNGRPVGAGKSRHKTGEAIDPYDPVRELAAWSLKNEARLKAAGIVAIEDPRWTPSWVHWQIVAVPSGRFVYIPSADPPLAAALPGQVIA